MKLYVANPLYDSVFKYLMEDNRIAKTLLSALLKKEVIEVKMRRHEYPNIARDTISMFRIDFAATVQEEDGHKHLILIELQKTWLETETLRFRQYLALQYNNKENMLTESNGKFAIPMVAVYLLGHKVGNIKEPVVYVNHKAFDYNGKEVKTGMPNPFVDSLQHDSIIVQIPLLHGQVNNRLEEVLSVFDQTQTYADDKRMLEVEENKYADDADMVYILHRLQSAAANPEIRNQMNAEDEFFKALEDRDTAIMQRDKIIKEKEDAIKEKEDTIKEKEDTIKEKEDTIKEKEDTILQQQQLLRSIIQGMRKSGMPIENIVQATGKSMEEINELIKNQQ